VLSSVSVALCTRNSSRFISAQVASILDQTVLPVELVVSDDASSDDTISLIEDAFRARETPVRLRILRNPSPLGVTANFEQAVSACEGPLIALSDHDDIWLPDRIAGDVVQFDADPDLLLLHSNAVLVDEDGHLLGARLQESLSIRSSERAELDRGGAFAVYLRRNLVTGAATMFRAELLVEAVPFPGEWVHDEWLGVLAAARDGARMSDRVVLEYRQHSSNEIGVREPTLRNRLGRMLEPRGDKFRRLADRAAILVARLDLGSTRAEWIDLARRKEAFERTRSAYPRFRPARVPAVLGAWRRGDYRDLSSQGSLDVVRDLVQPA
jgi:glycosyltransferase involved in cell wall biosynthesis